MDSLNLLNVGEYKKIYPFNFWFQVVSFVICLTATSVIASFLPNSTSVQTSPTQTVENSSIVFLAFQLILIPGSMVVLQLGLGLLLVNICRFFIIVASLPKIHDLLDLWKVSLRDTKAGAYGDVHIDYAQRKVTEMEVAFWLSVFLLLYASTQIAYGGYFEYHRVTMKPTLEKNEVKYKESQEVELA
eukprot:snap_masked-scaffold_54-processed-gene-1.45-mRNA-1 protein AED:1.00 eAED:1.00 QI:0/-1/0/0/-1/1/1/0/186